MNTTTRTLIAIPLAAAALSAGTTAAMAQPAGPIVSDLDIAQPEPQPEPEPGPEGPGDIGPAGDPDPDLPDDKDGPNNDPGPDFPDDLDSADHDDDDDGDNDDGDNDDNDNDDGDNDDGDNDDNDVKRPTRVDAGATGSASDGGLSFAWLLASGAMVTAAGGFTARRVALKRH